MVSTSFVDSDGVDQLCEFWVKNNKLCWFLQIQESTSWAMSQMVVNKMGPPSRMLIRWVCPNQQMVTFRAGETTNGTTRYQNHINKCVDQQDGSTTHIVVSGPISRFLLSRKHKMGCANCIMVMVRGLTLVLLVNYADCVGTGGQGWGGWKMF